MIKFSLSSLIFLFTSTLLWSQSYVNIDKKGIAISGYDPVSYHLSNKAQKGNANIKATHDGAVYLFSSESNKQLFEGNPQKYAPQFGGWCAYAVADSKSKVEIDPESFLIQDGRLLLFYNGLFADTRSKWQNTKNKSPSAFLSTADKNWLETKNKEP